MDRLLTDRARAINGSGIRAVFARRASMRDPIDLSIGQPNFPVPAAIKRAAIDAIEHDRNGYSVTDGVPELRARITPWLRADVGWDVAGPLGMLVNNGTSAAIALAFLALVGPGDEAIIPDPYFVMYPHMATVCGGRAVACDTYPDFRLTAERVEPLITPRTKLILLNSPSNPGGVVANERECRDLLDLCRRRNLVLLSDEIYDLFTYPESRTARRADGSDCCPSPARMPGAEECVLLVRGFGKTYGVTGWRLGFCAGPRALIEQMTKLQQYLYVCAPTPLQLGAAAAFDVDVGPQVREYQRLRDRVVAHLSEITEVTTPGGAFYAFPRVPSRLGITATQLMERCAERELLIVPGKAFSSRDTHFRLSYATRPETLDRGLAVLTDVLRA
ncbi:MAG: aminotransferase class I/II-fold pyridoxal phosphate-dependent enzyme [Phycisphaerales bacterium]|nr:aminotransferase class I/II-fold pyridoxal phosphate-dependent enzyme [Phycisphaerales bacterium]